MAEDHIVEIYAAADWFEAERLRELLEEAGIDAKVVGDEINHVAGSMPYGGVASPRLWVHEHDKDEAVQLIGQWLDEKIAGTDDEAVDQDEQQTEPESAVETDDEEQPVVPEGISALGKLLILSGLTCILVGASHGWSNHQLIEAYSGEVNGVLVKTLPIANDGGPDPNARADGFYEYQVNGEKYDAILTGLKSAADAPASVPVHFKPGNPREYLLGELPSPWLPASFGAFFGLLVMVLVYRLN